MTSNYYIIFPALLVAAVAAYYWFRSDSGRAAVDRWMLRVPIFGDLIRDMTIARFARSMSTLLAGGLTVPDAVDIASDSITNRELSRRSETVMRRIREGKPLTECLEEIGWVPELALDMVGVGESSGALQPMLDEVANFFDSEIDVRLSAMTTLIEPLILIFMGGLVMTILLAIYLPILQLVGSLGQGKAAH